VTGVLAASGLVLGGYLLGALPTGLIVGRLIGGVDPRQHGSGRTGATNVLRTIGPSAAAAVALLDLGKGVAAVLLAGWLYQAATPEPGAWVAAAAGLAAVAGHVRSVFIGFTGGRGMATFTGAMLAALPVVVAILLPVFIAVIWRWRFVSLGSVSVALLAPLVTAALVVGGQASAAPLVLAIGGAAIVTLAHRDNIARLRAGTERRLGQ